MSELNVGTINVGTTTFTGDSSSQTTAPISYTIAGLIGGSPSTDQVLKYNGTNWVAASPTPKSGSVVQFVDFVYGSPDDQYVSITADAEYDTPITVTITPEYADSKLVIAASAHTRANGAFGMSAYLKRDGSYVNGSLQRNSLDFMYKGESRNHHVNMRILTSTLANNTNSTTFTMGVQPYGGGGGNGEWNRGWGHNYIQVWEIKG